LSRYRASQTDDATEEQERLADRERPEETTSDWSKKKKRLADCERPEEKTSENIKPERMVSNGTPVVFHSVTLGIGKGEAGDGADADMASDEARLLAAGAGEEVILNKPPTP
jgi:hypothetical protein